MNETMKLQEEKLQEFQGQVDGVKAALKELFTFVIEVELDTDSDMYEEGDEQAPFFSETLLYNLLGKKTPGRYW